MLACVNTIAKLLLNNVIFEQHNLIGICLVRAGDVNFGRVLSEHAAHPRTLF